MVRLQNLTDALLFVKGVKVAAVVDYESGMVMASSEAKDNILDVEVVAAGARDLIHMQYYTMKMLGIDDVLHDVLISFKTQYHLLCPCSQKESMFLYMIIDRASANLAVCRNALFCAEKLVV